MDQLTRIQRIKKEVEFQKDRPYSQLDIPWNGKLKKYPVYEISLENLIFNQHNWRIRMRTKTYEAQNDRIDPSSPEGEKIIAQFLFDSSDRNKKTEEDLKVFWQKIPGIITSDGVIIDGNRRAMLLKKLGVRTFKTVVLDEKLEDHPLVIEELETRYQLGEDEKVWYNAIEKYLKVSWLKKQGVGLKEIAEWMGESQTDVQFMDEVMNTMDEYLEYHGYKGLYTQLDKREDPFRSLTKWLKHFYWEPRSKRPFQEYTDLDVDDLKYIAFDYIRIQFTWEEKAFRKLADWNNGWHLFSDKTVWKSFVEEHEKIVQPIKNTEWWVDTEALNFEVYLRDRDNKFTNLAQGEMIRNFEKHYQQIRNLDEKEKPVDLAWAALDKIRAINQKSEGAAKPETIEKIKEVRKEAAKMLGKQSQVELLKEVLSLLALFDSDKLDWTQQDEAFELARELNHTAAEIKKTLGG